MTVPRGRRELPRQAAGVAARRALGLLLVAHLASTRAWAYLDPGTASLGFQALLALVLGAVYSLKSYFRQLWKRVFARSAKTNPGADDVTRPGVDDGQIRG